MDAKQTLIKRGVPIKDFTGVSYRGKGKYVIVNPFWSKNDLVKIGESGFTIIEEFIIGSDPFTASQFKVIRDVEWKDDNGQY